MENILKRKFLVDTNILLYLFDDLTPFNKKAKEIMTEVVQGNVKAVIAQQNITEAINVLYRKSELNHQEILDTIITMLETFNLTIIRPSDKTPYTFLDLLQALPMRTKEVFDVFLAATMLDNGIDTIITANDSDFIGIEGITAHNPWKV